MRQGGRGNASAVRRAAWSAVESIERRMLLTAVVEEGVWAIDAGDGEGESQRIVIEVESVRPSRLVASVDGKVIGRVKAGRIEGIEVEGGAGDDTILFRLGRHSARLWASASGMEGDDSIVGGNEEDSFEGGAGDDSIEGGAGDDELSGGKGSDRLTGDAGDDSVNGNGGRDALAGAEGDDRLLGGPGVDQGQGGFGEDTVKGNRGDDTIWGGDGEDALAGGKQADTVYGEERDRIQWDRYDVNRNDDYLNALEQISDPAKLKEWIIEEAMREHRHSFGEQWSVIEGGYDGYGGIRPIYYDIDNGILRGGGVFTGVAVDSAVNGNVLKESPAPPDHSNTNTQESDVDEADVVKTDGQYLYVLRGKKLVIIDTWPAKQTHKVAELELKGELIGLYLNGDKVTVISRGYEQEESKQLGTTADGKMILTSRWWWSSPVTRVTSIDVSDRANPKVVEETRMRGSVSETRQIGGRLYLVMDSSIQTPWPGHELIEEEEITPEEPSVPRPGTAGAKSEDAGAARLIWNGEGWAEYLWKKYDYEVEHPPVRKTYRYESAAGYRARLEAMSLEDLLPGYETKVSGAGGQTATTDGGLASVGSLYVPEGDEDGWQSSLFSVVLFNSEDGHAGPDSTTSVVGWSGEVYASSKSMYVTKTSWGDGIDGWQFEHQTDIYKFDLGKNEVSLSASGAVAGSTLNQFSMDEEGEYFRIATTSSGQDGSSNNLFVMEEKDGKLETVGGITGLALTERIFAARFMADRAFLVTFRQVDPLFAIDLSDPAAPEVVGELKVPGFSSYLHPVGDDHLIGIGQDADENGRVTGLQVSLFDVSDLAEPKLVATHSLDTRRDGDSSRIWGGGSNSEAMWDHHAFSYFADQKILALPVQQWSYDEDGWKDSMDTVVLKLDESKGFTELGRVSQDWGGWGRSRNVRIGEFLYSLGHNRLKVVVLERPGEAVASVALPAPQYDDYTVVLA